MLERLKRPTDPYDPAWVEFRKQNPGLRLSLRSADPADPGDPGDPSPIDLSTFVPESFKGEDGAWDTEGFRTQFDELLASKTQADERIAELPEKAADYVFGLPENFELPEGFDAESLKYTDDDGNEVAFDPASMIDADDPDIPRAQELMHKLDRGEISGSDAMKEIAGIMASRELRAMMEGQQIAADEHKALGPNAEARISTITRALKGSLKSEQATAVLDSIKTADALRGIEALISKSSSTITPAPGGKSNAEMSIDERLAYGLSQRGKQRA